MARASKIEVKVYMIGRSNPARRRKKPLKSLDGKDISSFVRSGAGVRRNRLFREVSTFALPVLAAIVLQTSAYLAVYSRTVPVWPSALATILTLSFVPICSAVTLSAFRRQDAPIIASAITVTVYFSFAISFLSALRIHLSFAGFVTALPITMLIMAMGNIRFHKRLKARVALIAFKGDKLPLSLFGAGVTRITKTDADITTYDTILIEPSHHHSAEWSHLLSRCYVSGIDIMPWTQFLEIYHGRVHVPAFEISDLTYAPSQILYARVKRLLDLLAVIVTLPLTLPLAALTGLYIRLRDGAPILFVQHRCGFGGRVFRMYKFRTMYKGTGGGATGSNDVRIIPGCKVIRKLRLDELPQLYNILIGDMSLIGPRPEAVDLSRWYRREIQYWDFRMLVPPGITGWAQVNSGYTSNPDEARVKLSYDLYYVKHLSLDIDLQILFRTIKTVIFAVGAR